MAREGELPTLDLNNTVAWRYSNYDTPFWARANTRAGRWNVSREAPVQYLTLEPDAAWAELIRAENLNTEDEVAQVRMPIWVSALNEVVVDYSTFAQAELAGFPPDALVDDDWTRCQREGARLRGLGYRGVMTPSAALPGAVNVTIFGSRIVWTWNRQPVLAAAVQATTAAVGSPSPGLVERVRRVGTEHSSYAEYARIKAVQRS
jgi:RES domain-containing protein